MSIRPSRPATGAPGPLEFEYGRGGTLAYLVAWGVHAYLFARVEQTTGIVPFGRLVDQVMQVEPYRSARTVYWVMDNGSRHAGKTSVKRMAKAYPNARLIHLPVHASWLNQIEIYFSIVQRKALTPNDFATLPELATNLNPWRAPLEPHHLRTPALALDRSEQRKSLGGHLLVDALRRCVRGGHEFGARAVVVDAMDELDHAPRLATLDPIMHARTGTPPEHPDLTVSSA